MADLLMIAVTVGFYGLCSLYVSLCDRTIGSDREHLHRASAGAAAIEAEEAA